MTQQDVRVIQKTSKQEELLQISINSIENDSLYGACETFFRKDLNPEELEDVLSQCLVSGCDRDALSGWGGVVYIVTEKEIKVKVLKTKQT